jgi:hypothetical protein
MDDPVTLRPVSEDDLSWLASLRDGPAATGPHEWHVLQLLFHVEC